MKKKKSIVQKPYTPKEILNTGLIISFSWLILSALAYWKISPATYNEFNTTCQHFSYNDCMRWFYETKPYFTKVAILGLVLSVISLATTLVLYFKKK